MILFLKKMIVNFIVPSFNSNNKLLLNCPKFNTTSNYNYSKVVGVFFHYRDVKVILEELSIINFPLDRINLIARDCKKYEWNNHLQINEQFNNHLLQLPEPLNQRFLSYFNRGKYLAIVSGTQSEIKIVNNILNFRPKHTQVWYF